MKLENCVVVDEALKSVVDLFDYKFDGLNTFETPQFQAPRRDGSWNIGLIVGSSGSGKTSLLKEHYGITESPEWSSDLSIVSQVDYKKLCAVGLNSVPSWCNPFHVLSNGEQFRARLARMLTDNVTIDEFTSVIDRVVAQNSCHSIQKYIRQQNITGVVFASCHFDIIDWLQPDWIFNAQTGDLTSRGSLRPKPEIKLDIYECKYDCWKIFRKHHYLNTEINKSAKCFIGLLNDIPVAFSSCITFPSGTLKKAWREHRTVVLPDYQGLGLGVRISDFTGQIMIDNGFRYFSKTSHPRMGEYRNNSPLWRATCKNGKKRNDYAKANERAIAKNSTKAKLAAYQRNLSCYSHEYIGSIVNN